MKLVLSIITTLLILPALFSCTEVIDSPADEGNGTEVMTKVSLETPEDYAVRGAVDIFTFNNGGVRHLDSYQHMDSFSGQSIDVRSQSGEKTVFICTNAQRATYDWASVNSMEALDKAYLELQKEKRECKLRKSTQTVRLIIWTNCRKRSSAGKEQNADRSLDFAAMRMWYCPGTRPSTIRS